MSKNTDMAHDHNVAVLLAKIKHMKDLLRIESKRRGFISPWKCTDKDCPYVGRPTGSYGWTCGCNKEFERAHMDAVREAIK